MIINRQARRLSYMMSGLNYKKESKKMIDLHCHILPNLDDGPTSWTTTLNMCRKASSFGIHTIVATPHVQNGIYNNTCQKIEEKVEILNQKLKDNNILLQILSGSEIHVGADIIEKLKKHEFLSLNKSKYILLEFPHDQVPVNIDNILFQIQIMGFIPIIAHVERNLKIQKKPELLYQLIQKGVLAQITASSLCGLFGPVPKKISQKLLAEDLIYSMVSDAHSNSEGGRGSFFPQAIKEASKIIGYKSAMALVTTNPQIIISNQ